MQRVLFHKEQLSDALFEKGYAHFPLLNSADVSKLKQCFKEYHKQDPQGFYASTHLTDKNLRKDLSNKIMNVVSPKIEQFLKNAQLLGAAFISKAPGEKGILPLHQDWNIVDESEARSYNLWIPLIDVNQANGAMRVLDNSHRKLETFRGPNIPPVLSNINTYVDQHMHSIDLTEGEALLYDHALWHSSPVNNSDSLRLAIVIGVIPNGASMRYYQGAEGQIEEYKSHPEFFFENDRDSGADNLELIRKFPSSSNALDQDQFEAVYLSNSKNSARGSSGWINNIRKWFKK